jgi:hypothetical protein
LVKFIGVLKRMSQLAGASFSIMPLIKLRERMQGRADWVRLLGIPLLGPLLTLGWRNQIDQRARPKQAGCRWTLDTGHWWPSKTITSQEVLSPDLCLPIVQPTRTTYRRLDPGRKVT